MDDVSISACLLAKQYDIRSFFVSSEMFLPDLNDTLWCAIFVIQAFKFDFLFKFIEFSSLLFSSKNYNFFSTKFFDNNTLSINLPNVTLSNMSQLVYITLFGETDGLTLSRLDCISYAILEGENKYKYST